LTELSLTASQRTVIDALLAERDARWAEIHREMETRPLQGDAADRLCSSATAAQESCRSSIRALLLPEQQEPFDRLVKSGRWGRYTLVIPVGR
jgi:hypothetical protein